MKMYACLRALSRASQTSVEPSRTIQLETSPRHEVCHGTTSVLIHWVSQVQHNHTQCHNMQGVTGMVLLHASEIMGK